VFDDLTRIKTSIYQRPGDYLGPIYGVGMAAAAITDIIKKHI